MITFIVPDDVRELRLRIAELHADISELQGAPLSDKEAFEKARQVVQAHAARAQTGRILQHLIHGSASALIAWPYDPTSQEGTEIQPSAFDLLCAIDSKRMHELLKAQIKDSSHPRGVSKAERERRLAELQRDLRSAELDEEAAIVAAERAGAHVHRRLAADPAIILELGDTP